MPDPFLWTQALVRQGSQQVAVCVCERDETCPSTKKFCLWPCIVFLPVGPTDPSSPLRPAAERTDRQTRRPWQPTEPVTRKHATQRRPHPAPAYRTQPITPVCFLPANTQQHGRPRSVVRQINTSSIMSICYDEA